MCAGGCGASTWRAWCSGSAAILRPRASAGWRTPCGDILGCLAEPQCTRDELAAILADRVESGLHVAHDELLETAREIGVTPAELTARVEAEAARRAQEARVAAERGRVARRRALVALALVALGVGAVVALRR